MYSLKDKKVMTVTKAFHRTLDKTGCKPGQICPDKGSEFYNRSIKSWLQDYDTEIYSTHNEE